MKKLLYSLFSVVLFSQANAQIFWTEGFGTGCNQGQLANGFATTNGTWNVTATGTNDAEANQWFISAPEAGMGSGNCGDGCLSNAALTNRTLHVGNIALPAFGLPADNGAAYNAGGLCGVFFCVATDRRAESPVINCTGQTGITLDFEYIEGGQTTLDNATVWYFDGAAWSLLADMPKTTLCPSGQGLWATFSMALPASANNNPNVRIGFRWVNNDDGTGADPSFAVDNITLSTVTTGTPPVASFTASQTTICEGDCISFTNTSTGAPFTTTDWTFTGATPASSTQNDPTNICYATAGTYTVSLTVTNADGTDTETITNYITVQTCTTNPPVASFTASQTTICEGDCISFTNTSTGAPFTTTDWTFTGATPASSTQNNPTNICYATAGTYTVSLTVTNADGTDTETINNYITVQTCTGTPPTASFTASQTTVCSGNCITFQNLSTGTNMSYQWSFPGGTPSTSTQPNPTICYNTPGVFDVSLIVTDANGVDDTTAVNYITINACAPPTASFTTSGPLCENSCVDFEYTGTGATGWEWSIPGAVPGTSALQNPTFCFIASGTYNVQLIVTNSFGSDTLNQTINISPAPTVNAGFDELINIGESVTLSATGSPGTYSWTPSAYVSCSNCPITSATPPDTTDFVVYVTDANGCVGSDTVRVIVIFEQVIGVPSAFSPNGSGFNDILLVRGGNIASLKFRIFNRWGELVFESFDQAVGWDGTYKGKPENPGVFIYTVDYTFVDGKGGTLKGSVTLVK